MKIYYNNKIYVQVIDLMWLRTLNINIPYVIREPLVVTSYKLINGKIKNSDFICFDDEKIIKYFYELDFIIDYDSVKDLSLYKLILYSNNIKSECNNFIKTYNKMDYYDKIRNANLKDDINYLNIKWFNIRDYILYRIGIIKYDLPNGVKERRKICSKVKKNT